MWLSTHRVSNPAGITNGVQGMIQYQVHFVQVDISVTLATDLFFSGVNLT